MYPVEKYLTDIREIRSTGGASPETSYYGALETLLNEIGKQLKPRVRCVTTVADQGAGHPDGGLYTAVQFQRTKGTEPTPGDLPERGVLEIKSLKDDTWLTARGKQVSKYWGLYNQVLVTNYRQFVLVGRDENGKPRVLESFSLADTEQEFWGKATHARKTAAELGDRMIEYLRRVMLHSAPLTEPEHVAWYLASYAREARFRIEAAADLPGLKVLREALEECLGMKFSGRDGEHFFRATLVQTLFYGVFSSWVLWARNANGRNGSSFKWRVEAWNLHVPMIAGLFEQIATPQRLKPLGIDEVLDWAEAVLNRVVREEFFKRFEEEHAVLYFYEPFLKAYDPDLRKKLGVWYTPPEIVKYQVARVDMVLREELKIEDGLADPNVYVLDPCCGTGAYLVEVLRTIHETLSTKGGDALTGQHLKKAAIGRVFGFEILPAPFVIAHLQIGLLLRQYGAPLAADTDERAGVYLTNALTGWEPPKSPKDQIPIQIPEFDLERVSAQRVKREAPVIVVLGNPPYNAYAGTSPAEEDGLVEPYKEGLTKSIKDGGWGIKKFNLDDLYVRFFRIAERRIVKSGRGVVSFISNHSWISEPSFVVLRKMLLNSFDAFWIENLHGNRKISEYAPDGRTSETIFAITGSSPGIQQGVATSLWVKTGEAHRRNPVVRFRDDIDDAKANERRGQLLQSLKVEPFGETYVDARPSPANRYSFHPETVSREYRSWPNLIDLATVPPSNGLMEKRGGALIDIDPDRLTSRMSEYFDKSVSWEQLSLSGLGYCRDAARFDAGATRNRLLDTESFDQRLLTRYVVRPFDVRWCYYCAVRPLWNEPRPSYWQQCWEGNSFLVCRPAGVAKPEGIPFFFTSTCGDNDAVRGHAYYFPASIRQMGSTRQQKNKTIDLELGVVETKSVRPNLSRMADRYLESLGAQACSSLGTLWLHTLAIGYSPLYLSQNADGIRQDWPRIPLPNDKTMLEQSARLGEEIAVLLDTEKPVKGVTTAKVRDEIAILGAMKRGGGGTLDPNHGDLDLTAGWGHAGKGNATMPGRGKIIERAYSAEEKAAVICGAAKLSLSEKQVFQVLGKRTLDVYLNDVACWSNVPTGVWEYYIGGYQVVKKWLSYREKTLLGRGLTLDEATYVTEMVRRLAAIILLQPALDENYKQIKNNTYTWPRP